jgi:heme exporter protein B
MQPLQEIYQLLRKELLIERRQQFAIGGLLTYLLSLALITALALREEMTPEVWVVTYWLIVLFIALNAVAKSFVTESPGHLRYLYQLAAPESIILAKTLYNALLLLLLAYLILPVYTALLPSPFPRPLQFFPVVGLGCVGLASGMTLLSALAAQARNPATLMAVLSFPVLLPQVLLLITMSKTLTQGLLELPDLAFQGGIILVSLSLSVILYPFLWRG